MGFDLRKGTDQQLIDIRDACVDILAERARERATLTTGFSVATQAEYRAFLAEVRNQSVETLRASLEALERSNRFKDPDYSIKHNAIRTEIADRAKWGGRKPFVRTRTRRLCP